MIVEANFIAAADVAVAGVRVVSSLRHSLREVSVDPVFSRLSGHSLKF